MKHKKGDFLDIWNDLYDFNDDIRIGYVYGHIDSVDEVDGDFKDNFGLWDIEKNESIDNWQSYLKIKERLFARNTPVSPNARDEYGFTYFFNIYPLKDGKKRGMYEVTKIIILNKDLKEHIYNLYLSKS